MDTLQNMRVFSRVVETGSFTAAAQSLNSTTGAMSRAVSELEARLRTRLMNRSTRRLALTSAGESYRGAAARSSPTSTARKKRRAAHTNGRPACCACSFASVGHHYVLPALTRYHAQFPDVSIELSLSQRMPDLFDGTSDMAVVTASSLPDSELVSHLLGSTFSILRRPTM